jgi:phenylalanyl-tRNA synthetase alpha chain
MQRSEDVDSLRQYAVAQIAGAATTSELEEVRIALLGRKGEITQILKTLGSLDPDQRKIVGAACNELKEAVASAIDERKTVLLDVEPALTSPLDVTLPGIRAGGGGLHPTIQMMYDLNDAFMTLNFEVFEGPEITNELYEFDNLNFPPDHPARETMDSYWLEGHEHRHGGHSAAFDRCERALHAAT